MHCGIHGVHYRGDKERFLTLQMNHTQDLGENERLCDLVGGDTARDYLLSAGLLVKAEKVRYMTYTLMTPGCSRPDVGCTRETQIQIND